MPAEPDGVTEVQSRSSAEDCVETDLADHSNRSGLTASRPRTREVGWPGRDSAS